MKNSKRKLSKEKKLTEEVVALSEEEKPEEPLVEKPSKSRLAMQAFLENFGKKRVLKNQKCGTTLSSTEDDEIITKGGVTDKRLSGETVH